MLLFANGHEIAQMAEFHPMPPGYRTDRKDILDVSLVVILHWFFGKQPLRGKENRDENDHQALHRRGVR
jgi:hypothetical protein